MRRISSASAYPTAFETNFSVSDFENSLLNGVLPCTLFNSEPELKKCAR